MNYKRYNAVVFRETCGLTQICIFTDRGQALKRFTRLAYSLHVRRTLTTYYLGYDIGELQVCLKFLSK